MAENNDRNIPNLQENIKCLGLEPLAINQYSISLWRIMIKNSFELLATNA
jgi:hypothetical protein